MPTRRAVGKRAALRPRLRGLVALLLVPVVAKPRKPRAQGQGYRGEQLEQNGQGDVAPDLGDGAERSIPRGAGRDQEANSLTSQTTGREQQTDVMTYATAIAECMNLRKRSEQDMFARF